MTFIYIFLAYLIVAYLLWVVTTTGFENKSFLVEKFFPSQYKNWWLFEDTNSGASKYYTSKVHYETKTNIFMTCLFWVPVLLFLMVEVILLSIHKCVKWSFSAMWSAAESNTAKSSEDPTTF